MEARTPAQSSSPKRLSVVELTTSGLNGRRLDLDDWNFAGTYRRRSFAERKAISSHRRAQVSIMIRLLVSTSTHERGCSPSNQAATPVRQ